MKITKLDQDLVNALPVGKHLFRGKVAGKVAPTGFMVTVEPGGTRRFVLRYTIENKERVMKLGRTTELSAADAIRMARELKLRINAGEDPMADKHKAEEQAEGEEKNKFENVCKHYFGTRPDDMRSAGKMKQVVERLLYPEFRNRDVRTIMRDEIVVVLEAIDAENGREMSNKTFAHLRTILNAHATRTNNFNSPIVRGMRSKGKARDRMLLNAEIAALWRATEDPENAYGQYLRFLLLTACRRDEAASLPWSEINDSIWLLPKERNKTKVNLMRPLSDAALATLPKKRQGKYVFSLDGGKTPIACTNMTRYHVALLDASGTAGWVRHDLRRTARSLMSRARVPDRHAEECLGHLPGGIKAVYDVYEYFDEKREAYIKLERLINGLVDPNHNVVPLKTASAQDLRATA